MAYYLYIDVYVHPRNGEHLERLVTILRQVKPPRRILLQELQITAPLDADESFRQLKFYLSRGDPWHNEGISMFHLLRQFYSNWSETRYLSIMLPWSTHDLMSISYFTALGGVRGGYVARSPSQCPLCTAL